MLVAPVQIETLNIVLTRFKFKVCSTHHIRAGIEKCFWIIVAHSHIVDKYPDGEALDVVRYPCDVTVCTGAEVYINDLGPNALVLGLDVGSNVLKLEGSSAHLKN